ncbi:MAG TPA: diguanylate cyclase [Planctomycetota bacterium]|nr:diguanylate cyclase [Planctomycetota bacterium]
MVITSVEGCWFCEPPGPGAGVRSEMRSVATVAGLGAGAILTAVYFAAGTLGLRLGAYHPSISAVWPPTGIAIAATLLAGYRAWPAIFIGALLVNVVASADLASSAIIAVGNTGEALTAAWLVRRFAGGRAAFTRARTFFVFLLCAALGSSMISASVGVGALAWSGSLPSVRLDMAWITWWLGDVVGAILVAPLVVLWSARWPTWSWARTAELAMLSASLVLVSWLAFGRSLSPERGDALTFLPMPILIWAGFRFPPRIVAAANLLMAMIAIVCTIDSVGPFAQAPTHQELLVLQVFLGFMAGTGLTVALAASENREAAEALLESRHQLELRVLERTARLTETNDVLASEIRERSEAQRELAESNARFRELVESAPDAMVIIDAAGAIAIVNSQTERIFGYERLELIGQPLELLVPERVRERHWRERQAYMANPRVRSMGEGADLYGRRKDGSEFPIDISLSPLQTSGGPTVSASIRDVTRRKRAEQERLATEALRSQVAELTRRTREIGTLNLMADVLRAALSPEEAYPLIAPYLEEMFPVHSGAIYVFDEARSRLGVVVRWGPSPPDEPTIEPDSCWGLRRGQTHRYVDDSPATVCQHVSAPRPAVALCIPMIAKAQALGLFHLSRPHALDLRIGDRAVPAEYSEYKQKLAQAAAEQIAGAIANARLHQELRDQSIRDPLTGLFNRRSLEEWLARELHRAERRRTKVGLLMLDIDHFKKLNDRFGHGAGDLVLREIARLLERITRKEDLVCRYGGEEIIVVFAGCSLPDLRRRAQQIRNGIKGLQLSSEGRSLGEVTVSIGAALRPDHALTTEALLRAADEALYRAKRAGRDRVKLAVGKPGDGANVLSLPGQVKRVDADSGGG